jgi:hypothetical protein
MAIVRKLLIFASANSLIIQSHVHSPAEQHQTHQHRAIQIDFASRRISDIRHDEATQHRQGSVLEAHGLLGVFSVASSSFLVAVTGREQVAQIFGRAVYVVTDVEFLPLRDREGVEKAIYAVNRALRGHEGTSDEEGYSSDEEGGHGQSGQRAGHNNAAEAPMTPAVPHMDEDGQGSRKLTAESGIAHDVFAKRGNFGRFASHWFTRQGWGGEQKAPGSSKQDNDSDAKVQGEKIAAGDAGAAAEPKGAPSGAKSEDDVKVSSQNTKEEVAAMIPKILRTAKMIYTSRSFFFSYDFDLTRRLGLLKGKAVPPARRSMDGLYFWNQRIATPLYDAGQETFVLPVIQGFVGQREFVVSRSSQPDQGGETSCVVSAEATSSATEGVSHAIAHAKEALAVDTAETQSFLLTVISRRSIKRAGLRYLRRGIDDEGNCANCVETEQILSTPSWDDSRPLRSFTQIRASIPLYFSQSPYSFKPLPVLMQTEAANKAAMKNHFEELRARYGDVQTAVLVDKHGTEVAIGEAYEKTLTALTEAKDLTGVGWEWFDFHAECRGMRFENVQRLVNKLEPEIQRFGETVLVNGEVKKQQNGVIRTNCMDCLDRTNVAESAFGQFMLQRALKEEGFEIDLEKDESTTWFNTLWADNGDAISRQYAGTAALKGDFTRSKLVLL